MNYFLSYNNGEPLFIGGHFHGKKYHVPLDFHHYELVIREEPKYDFRSAYQDWNTPLKTELYRAEYFGCYDSERAFKIMVHTSLPIEAAFMLMLTTIGESSALLARIEHLERENAKLKKLLQFITS